MSTKLMSFSPFIILFSIKNIQLCCYIYIFIMLKRFLIYYTNVKNYLTFYFINCIEIKSI